MISRSTTKQQTHLIWKLIFVLSSGAMNVLATAPAIPPDAEWIKMLDLGNGSLCNPAVMWSESFLDETNYFWLKTRDDDDDEIVIRENTRARLFAVKRDGMSTRPTWWFLCAVWRLHCVRDNKYHSRCKLLLHIMIAHTGNDWLKVNFFLCCDFFFAAANLISCEFRLNAMIILLKFTLEFRTVTKRLLMNTLEVPSTSWSADVKETLSRRKVSDVKEELFREEKQ